MRSSCTLHPAIMPSLMKRNPFSDTGARSHRCPEPLHCLLPMAHQGTEKTNTRPRLAPLPANNDLAWSSLPRCSKLPITVSLKEIDTLIVPYDAHGSCRFTLLREDSEQLIGASCACLTALITDELIAELAGMQGEVIDLEREIYHLDVDDMPTIQVSLVCVTWPSLLRRLNNCGSRHEAVYLLRFLVARLCSTVRTAACPAAKNLRPEIARVRHELAEFMNSPFAS